MRLMQYIGDDALATPTDWTHSGTPHPGIRFGIENNLFAFSGTSAGTTANGSPVLGSVNARAVLLNTPNMPSSGDFSYVVIFRTAPASASGLRYITLFGVDGQLSSAAAGGRLAYQSPGRSTGSTTGATLDTANAGRITPRRQNSTWQWWPQGVVGADLANFQLEPDTTYAFTAGINGLRPFIRVVNTATGVLHEQSGGTDISGTRPAAPFYNLFGAAGSGGDRTGFDGACFGIAVIHGAAVSGVQLQALAAGEVELADFGDHCGGTTAYLNHFDFTTISGSALPSAVGSNAALLTGSIGYEPAGRSPPEFRFHRLGAYHVFPVEAGNPTSGKVWFEGYAEPGEEVACWLRYVSGTIGAQIRTTADEDGRFIASQTVLSGVPFYRSMTSKNDRTRTFHEYEPMAVGVVSPFAGQSQMTYLFSATWTGSADFTPVANQTGFAETTALGDYTATWASYVDLTQLDTANLAPRRAKGGAVRPLRAIGRGLPADGAYNALSYLKAGTSASAMVVNTARAGTPIDTFIYDRRTFSVPLTLSGSGSGPYTATVSLTAAAVQAAFAAELGADAASLQVSSAFQCQVRPGTFSLSLGGNTITDTKVSDSAGTLSGTGVSSGTITYVAGASTGAASISITFTGTPATTSGTLTFQPKQETLAGNSNNKTANRDGYGAIELLDDQCVNALRYGWTVGAIAWATANMSDGGGGAAARASLAAKHEAMRNLLKSYIVDEVTGPCADPPMIVCGYGRDGGNTNSQINNVRLFAEEMWASSRAWVRRGGHYYDQKLEASNSPHPTYSFDGGPRMGRRMGAYLAAAVNGATYREPVFGAAVRTSSTMLTVPLTTIGAGLSLTVASGGDANALSQWYVGGTLVANDATTIARIRSDGQAVELVKLSGSWAAGAESNVLYVSGSPDATTANVPASLLYDNRGGFGGNEPGLLAAAKLS